MHKCRFICMGFEGFISISGMLVSLFTSTIPYLLGAYEPRFSKERHEFCTDSLCKLDFSKGVGNTFLSESPKNSAIQYRQHWMKTTNGILASSDFVMNHITICYILNHYILNPVFKKLPIPPYREQGVLLSGTAFDGMCFFSHNLVSCSGEPCWLLSWRCFSWPDL